MTPMTWYKEEGSEILRSHDGQSSYSIWEVKEGWYLRSDGFQSGPEANPDVLKAQAETYRENRYRRLFWKPWDSEKADKRRIYFVAGGTTESGGYGTLPLSKCEVWYHWRAGWSVVGTETENYDPDRAFPKWYLDYPEPPK